MTRTERIDAGRVHGFLAHAEQPRGGIVILPTISAIDPFMQNRAQLLAQSGFTTIVWDPYPGEPSPPDTKSAMARAAKLNDDMVDDMAACAEYLRTACRVGPVGVLGFCLGGRYGLLLAAQDRRIAASVLYYPSVRIPNMPHQSRDAVALSRTIACPVMMLYGTADEVLTHDAFVQVRDALEQRPAATLVQVHPGAVHSFMRPDLQSNAANAAATRLSWPPAMAFIETCLSGG